MAEFEKDLDNFDDSFGVYDAECQVCDIYGPVNDMLLCEECAGKLERDLIRQRDWEYSVSAFAVPPEKREAIRKQVISQYGKQFELIEPANKSRKR